ncbi:uncharacterized protein LOC122029541 [Zingiber officinale]|uniref:uncharacterized protein LOC122029541 n=1 Tax=Zingiber officinale TaxID=94328 RepID=UPI001C4D2FC8|nr:uncharacterized protein LOC122029541 [Zingiber officinale]
MEEGFEGDVLLPDQSSSPLPKHKLRRLKRVSLFASRSPPTDSDSTSLPEVPLETLEPTTTLDFEKPVLESDVIGTAIDPELEFDPLFPDLDQLQAKNTDIGREKEDFFWGGDNGCGAANEINDGIENVKSAKKKLILEGEDEDTKKKRKKQKSSEKPKESLREKRKLEKERQAHLLQIHAESQRLLRETRDASFKPTLVVQKPISSVLEKIRLRKKEVFKKSVVVNHSQSIDDTTNCKADTYHDGEATMLESKKDDYAGLEENKVPHVEEHLNVEGGGVTTHDRRGRCNQISNLTCDVANNTLDADEEFNDSNEAEKDHQIIYNTKEAIKSTLSVLPTSFSELAPLDIVGPASQSLEGDENVNLQPHKAFNVDSYSDVALAKAFLDDEAEEEDDSDHDLMRFQENEDDESDDNEELTDMIATGFEEAPIDCERRNQLHQKWLAQQDTAATDNVIQRLRFGNKHKEPTLLHEEEASLEHSEESEDGEPSDLHPPNSIHKSTKMAKQMMAKMFTEDHDAYLPSDDEELEKNFIRQRLIAQNKEPALDSLIDVEHSREIFGLIKNMNAAPETKKRVKPTSHFGLLLTESSNSSSKSSFLGRSTSSSMQYSHKQSSSIARAFIFGRDDSNSRSSLPAFENIQEENQLENKNKKPFAKFSGPQMKSNASKATTESNTNSSSSLFEILQQSSIQFDKQLESKMSGDNTIEIKAAQPFSAFKIQRKFSKVSEGINRSQG